MGIRPERVVLLLLWLKMRLNKTLTYIVLFLNKILAGKFVKWREIIAKLRKK